MTTLPSPTTLPSVTSTFGEGDKRSRHPGSWVRALFRWAGIWGAACLIFVSQNALRYIMRDQPVDWFNALWLEALYWVPWLALTPVLLWAARSKPLGSGAPRSHIAWHLAIMVALSFVQVPAADALQYFAGVHHAGTPPAGGPVQVIDLFRRSFLLRNHMVQPENHQRIGIG